MRRPIVPIVFVFVVLLVAISSDSLWIDELTSAYLAASPTLGSLAERLAQSGSEAQMPLFTLLLWGWAKVFGVSELALRCFNIPWAIAGVASMAWFFRRLKCSPWALLLLCSPFLCYYMNEARPYMMTFAASAWAFASLETLLGGEDRPAMAHVLTLSVGLALGASMLNAFLLPALLVYAVFRLVQREGPGGPGDWLRLWTEYRSAWIAVAVIVVGFAVYYTWTLMGGHGGERESFTARNLGFAFYEFLGFGGLGAPRNVLREIGAQSAFLQYWQTVIIGVIVWLGFLLAAMPGRPWCDRQLRALTAALLAGSLLLVCAAVAIHVALWGRHLMFVLPLFLAIVARALLPVGEVVSARWRVAVLGALLAVFLLSAGRQRLVLKYGKDPFREAIAALTVLADREPDRPSIMVAYSKALWYYGHGDPRQSRAKIVCALGWPPEKTMRWLATGPDFLLLLHRPDKTDASGRWSCAAKGSDSRLVWEQGNMRIYRIQAQPKAFIPMEAR